MSSEPDDASETSSEDEPVRETEKLVQPQPVPAAVPEVAPEVTPGVNFIKLFPLSLMMRPGKLQHLSLENLSSEVLEFEGKARANPIEAPFRCFLLG